MAERPVFIPSNASQNFVEEIFFPFIWSSGQSKQQKQKNISALHRSASNEDYYPLLEVSTKSESEQGQMLSAFNLKINAQGRHISLESAFQASKVFENNEQFTDIYEKNSFEAKKDSRIKEKNPSLQCFNFFGDVWPLFPKTAFYDWLYLSALKPQQEELFKILDGYKGFTDIEFNPQNSINCQARSLALFISLMRTDSLNRVLSSKNEFLNSTYPHSKV